MQQFAIPRQYMSKNHNFSRYGVALLFWVFSKLVCCYVKKLRSNIHVIFKAHVSHVIYFLRNSVWTKNNKDMA